MLGYKENRELTIERGKTQRKTKQASKQTNE